MIILKLPLLPIVMDLNTHVWTDLEGRGTLREGGGRGQGEGGRIQRLSVVGNMSA